MSPEAKNVKSHCVQVTGGKEGKGNQPEQPSENMQKHRKLILWGGRCSNSFHFLQILAALGLSV